MRYLGTFRATALALASSIALVASFLEVSPAKGIDETGALVAQVETKPPTAPPPKPMQEERTNRPSLDPVTERIRYLHDRLRITAAQEPLWDNVAQVMRDNVDAVAPFIQERVQNAQHGNALEILNSYKMLGEAQLEGLERFIHAFQALYEQLSAEQKKIADSVFRLGPMGMVGGIPRLAEQLIAPETVAVPPVLPTYPPYPMYPRYPTYSVYPTYPYYLFYSYSYVPSYSPWIWGPPVGAGASFFFVHRHFLHHHGFVHHDGFHHHHGFHHSDPGGVPRSQVRVMHHR